MDNFAQAIKKKRTEKQMSTRALERALAKNQGLRLSRSFINYLENEKKKPTYEVAYALAIELGMDVSRALKLAYQARADFDRKREHRSLEKFLETRKLNSIKADGIVK